MHDQRCRATFGNGHCNRSSGSSGTKDLHSLAIESYTGGIDCGKEAGAVQH